MEDNNGERCTEFKDILKEHVNDLKSDMIEADSSLGIDIPVSNLRETDAENTECDKTCDETLTENLNDQVVTNDADSECLMLCGRILRLIGDEATCRACGKCLRNIGDEIFCNYATRNVLHSLLTDLSERRAQPESVR